MTENKLPEKGQKEAPAAKKSKEKNEIFTTGKRKKAVARACIKPGKGVVMINSTPIDLMPNEFLRLRVKEPLLIAGDVFRNYDFTVTIRGGGMMGQADAARQAIAKGLVEVLPDLKEKFAQYDRNLLVYDPRRTEPHKYPRSSQGPRRYKQRSKR